MPTDQLARQQYTEQQALVRQTAVIAQSQWRRIDRHSISDSWRDLLQGLLRALTGTQYTAAQHGAGYVERIVRVSGTVPQTTGRVVPQALAGIASDGRDLESLLETPLIGVFEDLQGGVDVDRALHSGMDNLITIVATQVADAGRVATGIGMVNDGAIAGYERFVNLPACGRCVILAGRLYSHSTGFLRHPRCDCLMLPVTHEEWRNANVDNTPEDLFASMSEAEQRKAFGKAGARAIRDGADIGQVVNARRGVATAAGPGGRRIVYTTEGTTARGIAGRRLGDLEKQPGSRYRRARAPRLMPEQIYAEADRLGWDRAEIVRQLQRFGYIT
ncbi:hypothetical protein NE236_41385 [Actinoallomurus purpureus]|uniref:hypothetical protein n=1 Tax=Actinoallomurus purpureus TaxID=478114 RepID=UPI002091F8F3|nr:hypothetical protein [Actinoallomurus purpureus]MCO6011423.1 hypothetical protein [Actinoallomurus purpureus]